MDNKSLKEEFEKFAKTFPQKIGGTAINAFADWWIQQMDLQRKELATEITQITPMGRDDYYGEWFVCDKCQNSMITPDSKYCPNCGRKIDKV